MGDVCLARVHHLVEVGVAGNSLFLEQGDDCLQLAVARPRAEAPYRTVYDCRAALYRRVRVGDGKTKVVVGVESDAAFELAGQKAHCVPHHLRGGSPRAVHQYDPGSTVGLQLQGLLKQCLVIGEVVHHHRSVDFLARLHKVFDVLAGDVCLGAVAAYLEHIDPGLHCGNQVIADGTVSGHHVCGELGLVQVLAGYPEHL